jgi:hypothetical protein
VYRQKAAEDRVRFAKEYEHYLQIRPASDVIALKKIRKIKALRRRERLPPGKFTALNLFFKEFFAKKKSDGKIGNASGFTALAKEAHASFKLLSAEHRKASDL